MRGQRRSYYPARRAVNPENAWKHWSFSKLDDLVVCPLQFWFRYIEKREVPHPVLPTVGSALHYIAKLFYRRHPSTKRYPYDTPEKLGGVWKRLWIGVMNGDHGPNGFTKSKQNPPRPIAWRNKEKEGGYWIGRGEEILRTFFEKNAPRRGTGAGVMREQRIAFPWMGLLIRAVIDRVDDVEGKVTIADYKMGNYAWYELEDSLQFTVYLLGYKECLQKKFNGRPLSGMTVETLSPLGLIHEVPPRGTAHFRRLHRILFEASAYVEAVLTGRTAFLEVVRESKIFRESDLRDRAFFPRLPRGDHCRYCNYVRECKKWEAEWETRLHEERSVLNSASIWREIIAAARRDAYPGRLELPFAA